jgi:hypothetical protein
LVGKIDAERRQEFLEAGKRRLAGTPHGRPRLMTSSSAAEAEVVVGEQAL